jgi:hypothetical protein
MVKSDLYKGACQLLLMGASEALTFLDALEGGGLLSRRTVAQYVLPALYGSRDVKEGTDGYRAIEGPLFSEVVEEMMDRRPRALDDPREEAVGSEAAMYLRGILEIATGDSRTRMPFRGYRYDGFSRAAYEEVRRLLGRTGMDYLGVTGRHESLVPSSSMVNAMVIDDESEGIPYSTYRRRVLCGDDPLGNDPMMEAVREEMEEYERWLETEEELDAEEDLLCGEGEGVPYQSGCGTDLDLLTRWKRSQE